MESLENMSFLNEVLLPKVNFFLDQIDIFKKDNIDVK